MHEYGMPSIKPNDHLSTLVIQENPDEFDINQLSNNLGQTKGPIIEFDPVEYGKLSKKY